MLLIILTLGKSPKQQGLTVTFLQAWLPLHDNSSIYGTFTTPLIDTHKRGLSELPQKMASTMGSVYSLCILSEGEYFEGVNGNMSFAGIDFNLNTF